ncbi:hypothetical protein IFM89_003871 [Coptis chinensis]|uniref:Uncharacterized protein n=1 Tax=Coptis chinensis TaxID=261450 RepID=A0A835HYC6_9MAGN|nr:hypothetical protein IFM89_003871 [Coptis chinensis]
MPLYDILNEFQKGHSHIAVVLKDLSHSNKVMHVEPKLNRRKHRVPSVKTVHLEGEMKNNSLFSFACVVASLVGSIVAVFGLGTVGLAVQKRRVLQYHWFCFFSRMIMIHQISGRDTMQVALFSSLRCGVPTGEPSIQF